MTLISDSQMFIHASFRKIIFRPSIPFFTKVMEWTADCALRKMEFQEMRLLTAEIMDSGLRRDKSVKEGNGLLFNLTYGKANISQFLCF